MYQKEYFLPRCDAVSLGRYIIIFLREGNFASQRKKIVTIGTAKEISLICFFITFICLLTYFLILSLVVQCVFLTSALPLTTTAVVRHAARFGSRTVEHSYAKVVMTYNQVFYIQSSHYREGYKVDSFARKFNSFAL